MHTHTMLMPFPQSREGSLGIWVGGSSRWAGCQEDRPKSVLAWGPPSISGPARRGGFGLALWLSHVWPADS